MNYCEFIWLIGVVIGFILSLPFIALMAWLGVIIIPALQPKPKRRRKTLT